MAVQRKALCWTAVDTALAGGGSAGAARRLVTNRALWHARGWFSALRSLRVRRNTRSRESRGLTMRRIGRPECHRARFVTNLRGGGSVKPGSAWAGPARRAPPRPWVARAPANRFASRLWAALAPARGPPLLPPAPRPCSSLRVAALAPASRIPPAGRALLPPAGRSRPARGPRSALDSVSSPLPSPIYLPESLSELLFLCKTKPLPKSFTPLPPLQRGALAKGEGCSYVFLKVS